MTTALTTKNGGTPRTDQRNYSKLQQVTAIMLSSLAGTSDASRLLAIPRRTLERWVAECGGLAELRAESGAVLGQSMYATGLVMCQQLKLKAPDMDTDQLIAALRALSVGATLPGLAEGGAMTPSGANVVQILIGDEAHREVIEVNRGNEPHS